MSFWKLDQPCDQSKCATGGEYNLAETFSLYYLDIKLSVKATPENPS